MATIRFEKVQLGASKSLPCPRCGKKVRRQTTFWQTISPFNKNADGQLKSREEIYAELRSEADEWKAKPVTCTPCLDEVGT